MADWIRNNRGASKVTAPEKKLAMRNDAFSGAAIDDATTIVMSSFIPFAGLIPHPDKPDEFCLSPEMEIRAEHVTDLDAQKIIEAIIETGSFDFHGANLLRANDGLLYFLDLEVTHARRIKHDLGRQLCVLLYQRGEGREREALFDRLASEVCTSASFTDKDRLSILWRFAYRGLPYPLPFDAEAEKVFAKHLHVLKKPSEGPLTMGSLWFYFGRLPITKQEQKEDPQFRFRFELTGIQAVYAARKDHVELVGPLPLHSLFQETRDAYDADALEPFFLFIKRLVNELKMPYKEVMSLLRQKPWALFCQEVDPLCLYDLAAEKVDQKTVVSIKTMKLLGSCSVDNLAATAKQLLLKRRPAHWLWLFHELECLNDTQRSLINTTITLVSQGSISLHEGERLFSEAAAELSAEGNKQRAVDFSLFSTLADKKKGVAERCEALRTLQEFCSDGTLLKKIAGSEGPVTPDELTRDPALDFRRMLSCVDVHGREEGGEEALFSLLIQWICQTEVLTCEQANELKKQLPWSAVAAEIDFNQLTIAADSYESVSKRMAAIDYLKTHIFSRISLSLHPWAWHFVGYKPVSAAELHNDPNLSVRAAMAEHLGGNICLPIYLYNMVDGHSISAAVANDLKHKEPWKKWCELETFYAPDGAESSAKKTCAIL